MRQEFIQNFMMKNGECFDSYQLSQVQQLLENIDDAKAPIILGQSFQTPNIILIIAIVLGWDRFFLDDIAMGVLKVITCYGCGIWWLLDIFTAKKRTTEYNFRKLSEIVMVNR